MGFEKFNSSSPEYKKVADLPKEKQSEFVDIPEEEGGGFVGKEAANPILEAKIEEVTKKDPHALENKIDELHQEAIEIGNDRNKLLETVRRNGQFLKYAPEDLRSDKEVVREAIKQDGRALEYASEDLRSDKEVVLEAVKKDGVALEYVPNKLLLDKSFLSEAAKVNPAALAYPSNRLKRRLGI